MVLPLIALAEAAIIIERGRTTISDVSKFLWSYMQIHARNLPLTLDVFERSLTPEGLRISELHDRFIVKYRASLAGFGRDCRNRHKDR